ncbi:mucin-5B-like [Latimeria chalumnae]|uniref:mucin-5B-like n=1 Tax=Latimeria chalumnae TaxID=7897 RepID=UPI00313BBBB1
MGVSGTLKLFLLLALLKAAARGSIHVVRDEESSGDGAFPQVEEPITKTYVRPLYTAGSQGEDGSGDMNNNVEDEQLIPVTKMQPVIHKNTTPKPPTVPEAINAGPIIPGGDGPKIEDEEIGGGESPMEKGQGTEEPPIQEETVERENANPNEASGPEVEGSGEVTESGEEQPIIPGAEEGNPAKGEQRTEESSVEETVEQENANPNEASGPEVEGSGEITESGEEQPIIPGAEEGNPAKGEQRTQESSVEETVEQENANPNEASGPEVEGSGEITESGEEQPIIPGAEEGNLAKGEQTAEESPVEEKTVGQESANPSSAPEPESQGEGGSITQNGSGEPEEDKEQESTNGEPETPGNTIPAGVVPSEEEANGSEKTNRGNGGQTVENAQPSTVPITEQKPVVEETIEEAVVGKSESSAPGGGEPCDFNGSMVKDGAAIFLRCTKCTCKEGTMICIKLTTCSGICSVTGSQSIQTFDGSSFHATGSCSYILLKTSDFVVFLNNRPCLENNLFPCIESFEVSIHNVTTFTVTSGGEVIVNEKEYSLPYHLDSHLTVRQVSSEYLQVTTTHGLHFQYDCRGNRLYVILETNWKGKTRGLCGTYNDNSNDDFLTSGNLKELVPTFFAGSWKANAYCFSGPGERTDPDLQVFAEDVCETLQNPIFQDCHKAVDPYNYQALCVKSIYASPTNQTLCSVLADYAYHCAQAGIVVPFRNNFTDCALECSPSSVFTPASTSPQIDCREKSDTLVKIAVFPVVDGCVCARGTYYNSLDGSCSNGDTCPCYIKDMVYKPEERIHSIKYDACHCQKGEVVCVGDKAPLEECTVNEVYADCNNGSGKACEPSCQNLEMLSEACPAVCQPGCICKFGFARSVDGSCVPVSQCPCVYKSEFYYPGESITQDCNTCTCEDGKFKCTSKECSAVCNHYTDSQYNLFDGIWLRFPVVDCDITLVEAAPAVSPDFQVSVGRTPCEEYGGVICKKNVSVSYGETHVTLSGIDVLVSYKDKFLIKDPVKIHHAGFYTIVEFPDTLSVYYDQHLDVLVEIQPKLKGRVYGMCGNADGTSVPETSVGNLVQFGARFVNGKCRTLEYQPPAPVEKHRKFLESRCNVLKGEAFAVCHKEVPFETYYSACVEETAKCNEGESCLCFCSTIAAYARACCRKGVSVDWRTPDTCPSPCEYYNRDLGEGPFHFITPSKLYLLADYHAKTVWLKSFEASKAVKMSFMLTEGLFKDPTNPRQLVSLESVEHPNFFVRYYDNGRVALEKWQRDTLFRKQTTFILRNDRWNTNYDAFESFVTRGYYLSAKADNSLGMTKYKRELGAAISFRKKAENFGLPVSSMCTWQYKSCESPCIKTCNDPEGTTCSLTIKVEGCFPSCSAGKVFDEVTHRCVFLVDCSDNKTTIVTKTVPPPVPTGQPISSPSVYTKPLCDKTTCAPLNECLHKDAISKIIKDDKGCCDVRECECPTVCPKPLYCGAGVKPILHIDPDTQCCATYTCPNTKPPPAKTIRKARAKDRTNAFGGSE